MFVVSNLVGSTIQITTLPLPVLSTLQASGLVFNTAFATIILKEPFTRYSLAGTILTVAGAALIATFGAIGEPAHSLRQLLDLLAQRGFIIWMVGTMLVAVGTIALAHILKIYSSYRHMSKHIHKTERPRSNSKATLNGGLRGRRVSLTAQLPQPLQLRISRLKSIRGLSYALISGILSAHSLLVAKSAVELLVRTIFDHDNQFNRFQSWLILLALLFFALSQLYYLHLGLRLCSTSILYPFVFCVYNIVAILDGLIYFQQASRLSALRGGLIALGTVILLSGVLALSWRLDDTTPTEPAPQVMDSQTSLAPGMGLIRSPEDGERSPLLPVSRSNTGLSSRFDERTPLLSRPARRTTLTKSSISPGRAIARDIWAELDDDEDYNIFSSFPRARSPSLSKVSLEIPKKRRASLPTMEESSLKDDSGEGLSPRKQRSKTLQTYQQDSSNYVASLMPTQLQPPETANNGGSSQNRKVSRDRRVTVRFEEGNLRDTSPRRTRGLFASSAEELRRRDDTDSTNWTTESRVKPRDGRASKDKDDKQDDHG